MPLKNGLSEDLELASLLILLDMTNPKVQYHCVYIDTLVLYPVCLAVPIYDIL